MGTYRLTSDDAFIRYTPRRFGEENIEEVLEEWLEKNADVLFDGEPVLYIGRQVATDLGKYLDLLAVDSDGDTLILELKKDRTPRDIVAQALEYAAYVSTLQPDSILALAERYLSSTEDPDFETAFKVRFDKDLDEVALNSKQRIVLVAQQISKDVVNVAKYLQGQGVDVGVLQFNYFKTEDGERLVSTQWIVELLSRRKDEILPTARKKISEQQFLDMCGEESPEAKLLYHRASALARERQSFGADDSLNWSSTSYTYRLTWPDNPRGDGIFIGWYDNNVSLRTYIVNKAAEAGQKYMERLSQIPTFKSKIGRGKEPFVSIEGMPEEEMDQFIDAIRELAEQLSGNHLATDSGDSRQE